MPKPNILYIFTDQLRADALGFRSGGEVITPHLDRLAEDGVAFTRFLSNAPICVPARSALMTGLLPRENGVWSNRAAGDPAGPSHVRNVREAGYRTAVIGKTHLWRHGPGPRTGRHVREMDHVLAEWGFDERIEISDPMETRSMYCNYTDHLESLGLLEAQQRFIAEWADAGYRRGNPTPWTQQPAPVPEGEDIDSFVGRKAVEWISAYAADAPFYLQVQFTGPHDPYDGPYPYRARYLESDIDPGLDADPLPDIQVPMDRIRTLPPATTAERQRWRVAYYANVTLIDEWIGQVLEALERRGMLADTWVVFTSDHGEMLGDHRLWSKAVWYDAAVRVPLVVRPPADAAGTRGWATDALSEQIDVPATILDIAGAEPLEDSLGRSLAPAVLGDADGFPGKEAVLSELFGETTLITDRAKLTVKAETDEPRLLFDLEEDPQEMRNGVGEARYAPLIEELVETRLKPLHGRLSRGGLADYRRYVEETGSAN